LSRSTPNGQRFQHCIVRGGTGEAKSAQGCGPAASAASRESLKFAINHVFLPPRTPQEDDGSVPDEHTLISLLLESVKEFARENPPNGV
jgi:hypothetical protein